MADKLYVDSSNIEAIGYDDDLKQLHVWFLSGGYYIYYDVPCQVYDDFINATSKGSFLNREIKGVYEYAKQ